jgi:hypothetical protein
MKLYLEFINIVDSPLCCISINGNELYSGPVPAHYSSEINVPTGESTLIITHWGKKPEDTVVEQGIIVRDRSFELSSITIDDYNIEELKWQSEFQALDGKVYASCLFFGPNGQYILKFENPVLFWMLKTRHNKNKNDPHWEEDYNYYTEACRLLKQISGK